MRGRVLCILLVLSLSGCDGCRRSRPWTSPDGATDEPTAVEVEPPAPRKLELGAVTLEEAAPLFVVPGGARVLSEPFQPKIGARISARYCVGQAELGQVADDLRRQIASAGWENARARKPEGSDFHLVTGQKSGYALIAQVSAVEDPLCPKAKGQTLVAEDIHKLELTPVPGAESQPGGSPL